MLTQTRSMYQIAAAKRFPLSASIGNIKGDGTFALVSKCKPRWRVVLFHTAEDRDAKLAEWNRTSCPAKFDCCLEHSAEDIHLR
jgi:hypothetical protein